MQSENNLLFNQIIWRTLQPIKKKNRLGVTEWFEIQNSQAMKLLNEFEGVFFEEIIYHYENKVIEIFMRNMYQRFSAKNIEFDIKKIFENYNLIKKIIATKSNDFLEIRFIFIDGRLDIVFKNMKNK